MSGQRQRTTWAAEQRRAAAPPALPGYDVEDQDHPAKNQPDPEAHDYENGDTSQWNEDPTPPPYGDSGPPALPGYGAEDQDHPAHQGQVGRKASLGELVRRKSAKCLVIARQMLGPKAKQADIEDQALTLMDTPDPVIDATMGRMGDFMAADESDMFAMDEELLSDEEEFLAADEDGLDAASHGQHKGGPRGGPGSYESRGFTPGLSKDRADYNKKYYGLFGPKGPDAKKASLLDRMAADIAALRKLADQNDAKGETLAPGAKSEDQEKGEEDKANKEAALKPILAMFDAMDHDHDGFITASEWKGPRSMFASLDSDKDGIIARFDLTAKKADDDEDEPEADEPEDDEAKDAGKKAKKADEDEPEADEDEGKEAKKAGEMPPQFKENAEKKKDEAKDKGDGEKDEKKDDKKPDFLKDKDEKKAAAKLGFGHYADLDEDELEMLSAMQYGEEMPSDEDPMACGDEGDEVLGGEDFTGYFAGGTDPMGLAEDDGGMTPDDEAAFAAVFGKNAAEGDEDEEEKEEDEDEGEKEAKKASRTASTRLPVRPQPRKASTGVKQIGGIARTASRGGEIDELSKLWESKPDVRGAF